MQVALVSVQQEQAIHLLNIHNMKKFHTISELTKTSKPDDLACGIYSKYLFMCLARFERVNDRKCTHTSRSDDGQLLLVLARQSDIN